MFLPFFLASCFSLDESLASLSHRARSMAKRPRASFSGRTEYPPGHYDLGGATFYLSHPLIGGYTPSVSGYASSHSVLAVISEPIAADTIFVDAEHQTLLQVSKSFLSDGQVTFYNVTLQNPLAIFNDLKMKTSGVDTSAKCSTSLSSASAECSVTASYNWDATTKRPIPIQISDHAQLFLGAYLGVSASAQASFHGIRHITIDYSFGFEGDLGVGIYIDQSFDYIFPEKDPYTITIWGWRYSVLGFTLSLSVDGYVGVYIREVDIELPRPIEYYRVFTATVKKQGSLSTSGGFSSSPVTHEFASNADQSLNASELFEILLGIKLIVKPELKFGIEVQIILGTVVNYQLQLGVVADSEWTFSLNPDSCPCPYLYGSTSTDMKLCVDSHDFKLFGYKLLKAFYKEIPIFTGLTTPGQCLFSPSKTKEGVMLLRMDVPVPAYIVTDFTFTKGDFQTEAWDFQPAIQALDSTGHVFQDLQLPEINWKATEQTQSRIGRLVLALANPSSTVRWYGYQAVFWLPRSAEAPANLTTGRHDTAIGSLSTVQYSVAEAQGVEIFKEFPGTNNAYISFKPDVPAGSILGVIVHSVTGEAMYSAPPLQHVFDDASLELDATEFLAKDQVEIEIVSFCPKDSAAARLTFKRGSAELKVALANNLKPGVSVSNPFDISQVTVDLSNPDPLTIEILLAQSETTYTTETVTIAQRELTTGSNFTLQRSSNGFDLTLQVIRTQPNVVFQFSQPLTDSHRAIVCRVTQGFSPGFQVTLQPTESYGILRFKNVSVHASASVVALVSMLGLMPLCGHRQLDAERVVIPLLSGVNVFGSDIHIPFRRASGGFETTARLDGVFATTADGLCGSGVNITTESPGPVACLESVTNNGTDLAGWTAFSHSGEGGRLAKVSTAKITILGDGWRLQTFQAPVGLVELLPSTFTIPEDVIYVQLRQSAVQPFVEAEVPVFVRCDRAQWVERTCGVPQTRFLVERGNDGLFAIDPCGDTDLLIGAVCKDAETAFCQFTVKLDERTLLQYDSAAGVFEVGDNGTNPEALLPGVSRQVIGPRGPVRAYKSWNGSINQLGEIQNPAKLTVKAKVDGGKVALSLVFGSLPVPFSAGKCYTDPDGFFTALGIAKPEEGYTPEVVNFTENADVEAAADAIDLEVLKRSVDVERTTDLPKELVSEQEFVLDEPEPGYFEKGVNVAAIVGGAVAGFVVIVGVVVVVVVYKRRKVKRYNKTLTESLLNK